MILSIAIGLLIGSLIFAISAIKKLQKKLARCEDALWHSYRTMEAYHLYMDAIVAGKTHDEGMDIFTDFLIKMDDRR